MTKFILFLLLSSCAPLTRVPPEQALGGAASGVIVTKTLEKTKEVFQPHYPLLAKPSELCSLSDQDHVICFIIPCNSDTGKCTYSTSREDWLSANQKVFTLRTSQIPAIKLFCERNKGACEEYLAYYAGSKIIVKRDIK